MIVASILRDRTRGDHVRTEAIYADFDLQSLPGYSRFLIAQSSASLAVERSLERAGVADVIEDWPERRRSHLLRDDLSRLNLDGVTLQPATSFGSTAEILGAVYVLEGSRLGGKILRKQVLHSAPARFLGAEGKPGAWRGFLSSLDCQLRDQNEIDLAVDSAKGVFATFQAAGRAASEIRLER